MRRERTREESRRPPFNNQQREFLETIKDHAFAKLWELSESIYGEKDSLNIGAINQMANLIGMSEIDASQYKTYGLYAEYCQIVKQYPLAEKLMDGRIYLDSDEISAIIRYVRLVDGN
jgi:hypothetical protein